jgi:hypothetical protein
MVLGAGQVVHSFMAVGAFKILSLSPGGCRTECQNSDVEI